MENIWAFLKNKILEIKKRKSFPLKLSSPKKEPVGLFLSSTVSSTLSCAGIYLSVLELSWIK